MLMLEHNPYKQKQMQTSTNSYEILEIILEKPKRDRIRNEIFEEAGIKNLEIQLEKKWLQWVGYTERTNK